MKSLVIYLVQPMLVALVGLLSQAIALAQPEPFQTTPRSTQPPPLLSQAVPEPEGVPEHLDPSEPVEPPVLEPCPPGIDACLPGFDPARHGFSFTNDQMTTLLSIALDIPIEEWEAYQQETLQWLFEPDEVCFFYEETEDTSRCVPTSRAQGWLIEQYQSMQNGLCDGLAAGSLYFWQYMVRDQFTGEQDTVLLTDISDVFAEESDDKWGLAQTDFPSDIGPFNRLLQRYITDVFMTQSVEAIREKTEEVRLSSTPNDILTLIRDSFNTQEPLPDPYTVGIYQLDDEGQLINGHTLTPYAIEDVGDGIHHVYVYDSNYPDTYYEANEPLYVVFNQSQNTWFYDPGRGGPNPAIRRYEGKAGDRNLDLTRLSWRNLGPTDYFPCPFCNSPTINVSLTGEGRLAVVNQANGVQIEPAVAGRSRGGLGINLPPIYRLSPNASGDPHTIRVSGSTDASLVLYGNGFSIGLYGLRLSPEQTLVASLYNTPTGPSLYLTLEGGSSTAEVYLPYAMVIVDNPETDTGYTFYIEDLILSSDKLVGLRVNQTSDSDAYLMVGDTDNRTSPYLLTVERYSTNEFVSMTVPVDVAPGQIAFFYYNDWTWQPTQAEGTEDVPAEAIPLYLAPFEYAVEQTVAAETAVNLNALSPADQTPVRNGGRGQGD